MLAAGGRGPSTPRTREMAVMGNYCTSVNQRFIWSPTELGGWDEPSVDDWISGEVC